MPWANWHLSPYLQVPCSWKGRHISVLYLDDCWPLPLLIWGDAGEMGDRGDDAWLLGPPEPGRPQPTGHSLSRRDRESPKPAERGGDPAERLPSGSDWSQAPSAEEPI